MELLYAIRSRQWEQGFATERPGAVLEVARELGMPAIAAFALHRNSGGRTSLSQSLRSSMRNLFGHF